MTSARLDSSPATCKSHALLRSQTEDDLIWPVLARLGWTASLRQQNLSAYGRVDVPDGLLFADEAAKDQANGFAEELRYLRRIDDLTTGALRWGILTP